MKVIDISNYENEIVLCFGKQGHQINAYTLASTLVSIADAIKAANSEVNPGYDIEVVVTALPDGSFRTVIRAIYTKSKNLFSIKDLKSIVLSILASYLYTQIFTPDSNVTVNVGKDEVVIVQGDTRVVIPREVHDETENLKKSKYFKESIAKVFSSVQKDKEIESFGILSDLNKRDADFVVDREKFPVFIDNNEINDLDYREINEKAEIQIIRAILDRSGRKWEFVWRGVKIAAPIVSDKFYDDFFAHSITIAPGDSLNVTLKIYQAKHPDTGIYTNEKYEVVEVHSHNPKPTQLSLEEKR